MSVDGAGRADGDAPPVRAIERIFTLFGSLASGPQTLGDISATLDMAKGATLRLTASLLSRDIISRDAHRSTYFLGPAFVTLVQSWYDQFPLASLVGSNMEALSRQTGETVTLAVRIGNKRVVVRQIESEALLRYSTVIGATLPLYTGAAGRVFLAYLTESERSRVLDSYDKDSLGPHGQQRSELLSELEIVARQGYAVGSRLPGLTGLSVPILREGDVAAVISVLGPSERFTDDRMPLLLAATRDQAVLIERRIPSRRGDGRP